MLELTGAKKLLRCTKREMLPANGRLMKVYVDGLQVPTKKKL